MCRGVKWCVLSNVTIASAGVFLGVSLLSLAEVVYWLVLRGVQACGAGFYSLAN